MAVVVKLGELKRQVNVEKWNRKQLMEYYGLNSNQLTKLLKKADLKVSRVKESFVLEEDDLLEEVQEKLPEAKGEEMPIEDEKW